VTEDDGELGDVMMDRNEATSSMAEEAQAAGMNEPLATACRPRKAPSVLPGAVDEITQAGCGC
jgi:hypothetical protein